MFILAKDEIFRAAPLKFLQTSLAEAVLLCRTCAAGANCLLFCSTVPSASSVN
jgi:hypothetical protein